MGSGLAAQLLAEGEARLAQAGCQCAHLLCLPENPRAVRFYTRQGWTNAGRATANLDTLEGPYPLELFRFEKDLSRHP